MRSTYTPTQRTHGIFKSFSFKTIPNNRMGPKDNRTNTHRYKYKCLKYTFIKLVLHSKRRVSCHNLQRCGKYQPPCLPPRPSHLPTCRAGWIGRNERVERVRKIYRAGEKQEELPNLENSLQFGTVVCICLAATDGLWRWEGMGKSHVTCEIPRIAEQSVSSGTTRHLMISI